MYVHMLELDPICTKVSWAQLNVLIQTIKKKCKDGKYLVERGPLFFFTEHQVRLEGHRQKDV